jgi:GNAT superfamily N-acetyltransferase
LRILEFDKLPSGLEPQAQLLDLSAAWAPNDFKRFKEARRMGYPSADYVGVYAVENGEILSAVRVLRLPYTTPEGVQQIAGIQGVVTRRDSGRKELARRLLLEVHRREKAAGIKYSLLWTGRGQVAHSLYESLGYRDVYTPELAALRKGAREHGLGRYTLKDVKEDGVGPLEALHEKATMDRLGFTPRPSGIVRSLIHLGFLARESLQAVFRGGRLVGYALLQKHSMWCSLDELILDAETPLEEVLPTLEAAARGGWFVIRNTSVRDALPLLRKRGYHYSPFAYYSLMALPLEKPSEDVAEELGSGSPRFTCQHLDYF